MTKDEAFKLLEEAVAKTESGEFNSVNAAIQIAAMALNYIMDNIEDEDDNKGS